MKICFLLGGLTGNGGIGRVTSVLTNKLVNKYDVDVFVVSYADTHKPQLYELDSRIHTHMLFNNPISMKKAVLCNIVGKLKKYLNENKIDVLIACGSLFFPVAVRACRRIATKCVCWDHTAPHVTTDHAFQAWSRKYGAKHSDINALITLSAKRFYDENFCDSQKNILIYNPIDPIAVSKRKEYDLESKKIISVGRLTYPKNFELLIRVASKVLRENPDWTWDIYGDGELRLKLQALIEESGVANSLTLKGQVSDIYDRYGGYAFKVLTSRYEGFPMTLLEASANGLPMISFDIKTGPNEIIEHGTNGLLVPAENEEEMENAINTLIRDSELRRNMSEESARSSERFQIDEISEQWYGLFKDMLR